MLKARKEKHDSDRKKKNKVFTNFIILLGHSGIYPVLAVESVLLQVDSWLFVQKQRQQN